MPSKKKKYNARFPAGRIKKIMQSDEEVGKVAQAVPIIISRTLELFVESLLTKSTKITQSRNAKTLTPSHMKQCILSETRFDFLRDLVKDVPDASVQEDNENNIAVLASDVQELSDSKECNETSTAIRSIEIVKPTEIAANFYTEQIPSASRTPVIQYVPKVETKQDVSKFTFSVENLVKKTDSISDDNECTPETKRRRSQYSLPNDVPALIPVPQNYYTQSTGDNLYIDEDYDN